MLLQIVILTSCSLAAARDWAFTILSDDKYVIMYLGVCLSLSCHITDPQHHFYTSSFCIRVHFSPLKSETFVCSIEGDLVTTPCIKYNHFIFREICLHCENHTKYRFFFVVVVWGQYSPCSSKCVCVCVCVCDINT